jgi:membrane protease YdiL (CAAX protease family)
MPLRLPSTKRQLVLWTCVSLVAGVGEEIIYRGVMFSCLDWYINQPIISALICASAFAIAHITQGARAAWFVFFMALAFHALVWVAGNLYMAMIVHAIHDFAVGLQHLLCSRTTEHQLEPV